jgi:RimJ/RimL family protein N-acetyltransferase
MGNEHRNDARWGPRRGSHEGRWVSLVPLDAARDVAGLHAASHGSEEKERVWTYMGYGPFPSAAAMEEWLAECAASTDPAFFTVVDAAASRPLGIVSFLALEPVARRLELGHIWYGAEHQRGRANTEAAYLMLREAFDELGCRRVEWKCDASNAASRAAAERLGFTYEGCFRQHLIVKGRNRDTAWFSMLDGEWPAARAALERWLASGDEPPPSLAALRAGTTDGLVEVACLDAGQAEQLHRLYQAEWWTKGRSLVDVRRMLASANLVFGLLEPDSGRLVGFTRVLTDDVYKALVLDVIVAPDRRGEGLGERLMRRVLDHPRLAGVQDFELYCAPDMEPFYERFGFRRNAGGTLFMIRG